MTDDLQLDSGLNINLPSRGGSPSTPTGTDITASSAALAAGVFPVLDDGGEANIREFNEGYNQMLRILEQGNESMLREDMARMQRAEGLMALQTLAADALARNDVQQLDDASVAFKGSIETEIDNYFALEQMALDRLEELRTADPLEVALERDDTTMSEYVRDQLERKMIISHYAEKVQQELEDVPGVERVFNFLASIVPFNRLTTVDDITEEGTLSGTKLKALSDDLYLMNRFGPNGEDLVAERVKAAYETLRRDSGIFFGDNLDNVNTILLELQSVNEREKTVGNFWDYVDIAAMIPFASGGRLGKAAVARTMRNRELAKTSIADTIQKSADGQAKSPISSASTEDALDEIVPSAMKTTDPEVGLGVSLGDEVSQALDVQKSLIKEVESIVARTGRLTQDQVDAAVDDAVELYREKWGADTVKDYVPIIENGQTKISMVLGSRNTARGGGFTTKSGAKRAMKTRGLSEEGADLFQGTDGSWYIKYKQNLTETPYILMDDEPVKVPLLRRLIGSAASTLPDEFVGAAALADFQKSALLRTSRELLKDWDRLPKESKKFIGAVMARGQKKAKWFTPDEFQAEFYQLNGRLPNDGEFLGYYTRKNLSDMEYSIRNHSVYTRLASDGWVTGRIEVPGLEPIEWRNIRELDGARVPDDGIIHYPDGDDFFSHRNLSPEDLKKLMDDEGLSLYAVSDYAVKGRPINYVLTRKGNVSVRDLQYRQLSYSGGGHRMYDGQVFVKQAKMGEYSHKGKTFKYVANPRTHIVTGTRREAEAWVERYENVRQAWVEHGDSVKFQRVADEMDIDPEYWKKAVEGGHIEVNSPFRVVFGNEVPVGEIAEDTINMSRSHVGRLSHYEEQGQMYYSRKGKTPLKGPQDEAAILVDPVETANRAINQASTTTAYMNYRIKAVDGWLNQYGHLLEGKGLSGRQSFWADEPLTSKGNLVGGTVDQAIIERAELRRQAIKRQLGHETTDQILWRSAMHRLGQWTEGTRASKKFYDAMSHDPLAFMKGVTFNLKLGLGDPSQLLVQTQTAVAIGMLDPLNAPKFLWDTMMMRRLAHNGSEEILNWAAKRSGMDPDEFKLMSKEMRESGIADLGGELIYLDHHASPSRNTLGTLSDLGRWPFYEAERLNRLFAFRKAWNDLREVNDLKWMTSTEGRQEMARLTNKWTMDMTRASSAAWQRGPLAVPTQFLSYMARMYENMLPQTLGGSKTWTGAEKARLFLSQVFLYGAAGVPTAQYFITQAQNSEWIDVAPENTDDLASNASYRMMMGGFYDALLYTVTTGEVDMAFSQRLSVAQQLEQLVEDLMGRNQFGDTSFFQIIAGAAGGTAYQTGSDVIDGMADVYKAIAYSKVPVAGTLQRVIPDILDNASTFSRAQKAYLAFKYNQLVSGESGRSLTEVTTAEAFAIGLGFKTKDMADMELQQSLIKDRKNRVKELFQPIRNHWSRAWRAYNEGDKEEFNRQLDIVNGWMHLMDWQDRADVGKLLAGNKDAMQTLTSSTNQMFQRTFGKTFNEGN